jgi:hypothetical protein
MDCIGALRGSVARVLQSGGNNETALPPDPSDTIHAFSLNADLPTGLVIGIVVGIVALAGTLFLGLLCLLCPFWRLREWSEVRRRASETVSIRGELTRTGSLMRRSTIRTVSAPTFHSRVRAMSTLYTRKHGTSRPAAASVGFPLDRGPPTAAGLPPPERELTLDEAVQEALDRDRRAGIPLPRVGSANEEVVLPPSPPSSRVRRGPPVVASAGSGDLSSAAAPSFRGTPTTSALARHSEGRPLDSGPLSSVQQEAPPIATPFPQGSHHARGNNGRRVSFDDQQLTKDAVQALVTVRSPHAGPAGQASEPSPTAFGDVLGAGSGIAGEATEAGLPVLHVRQGAPSSTSSSTRAHAGVPVKEPLQDQETPGSDVLAPLESLPAPPPALARQDQEAEFRLASPLRRRGQPTQPSPAQTPR